MPTNLPPDAKDKWAEVEATRNPREKIKRMQEFLSLVPQHKGTMKLRGQIKKKMAVLRKEMEERKQKRAGRGGQKFFIEKEGAAQVALLGVTNVGKSCLLSAVTNANVAVSPAPYTTHEPVPAVMSFEDVQFQVVEAPAVMEGSAAGRAWGLKSLALARNADGLILMVDLSRDPVAQLSLVLGELEKARVLVSKPRGRVDIDRRYMGAGLRIILVGKLVDCSMHEVEALLRSYRIADAVVKISGEVTLDEVEDAIFESTTYKPAIVVANKLDVAGAEANLQMLESFVDGRVPVIAVSCEKKLGLEKLGETLFRELSVIRIYTKEPGVREPSQRPFTLRRGATVADLARSIHSDFERDFAFARIWAERLVFSPQKFGCGFVLEDGDVVEIHLR
ncbi:MAG: 50S ribosome-binding GTPase [Candidatus Bathyarchaeota archaeon]|nr:MAG: 50S ribosome-binding GTPase [Candidatus Bathyarchaeota archaeon]